VAESTNRVGRDDRAIDAEPTTPTTPAAESTSSAEE